MASLIERAPCEGLLPLEIPECQLTGVALGQVTSIAPFNGKDRAVAVALKPLGLSLPKPGKSSAKGGATCLWTGQGQAFLIGAAPPETLQGLAALTDQSDGWAAMRLDGLQGEAVLARLVPLDLRMAAFARGAVLRSQLGHMPMILRRTGAQGFQIMVFRSMAATAVHELHQAMRSVAARG